MVRTKDIIALATHITKRGKGIHEHRSMYPVREWLVGLLLFTALFLAGSVYAGMLFLEQLQSFDAPVAVDTGIVKYRQEVVGTAIDTYRHRAAQFHALREREGIPVITYATSTATTTSDGSIESKSDDTDASEVTPIPSPSLIAE